MTNDKIRYDLLVQNALKSVLHKVLSDVARNGLPDEHHFFISFRTDAQGVRASQRLHDKYPEEMTIVMQHQFWDLSVTEHAFEIGLSFAGIPERLLVPFDAITAFFDPSVQFGLKFEIADLDDDYSESMNDEGGADSQDILRLHPFQKTGLRAVDNIEKDTDDLTPQKAVKKTRKSKSASKNEETTVSENWSDGVKKDEALGNTDLSEQEPVATVVSLDAFRKRGTPPTDKK